ncbi:MAG: NAD(P)H-binding protein, partial [Gemmatimonadota bacterium]
MTRARRVLLTGATGYVGGRLLAALEAEGRQLRCMVRRPEYLLPRVAAGTEVVAGDVFDPASLEAALAGVDTAYYLVHSMEAEGSFEDADRRGASNFARAARARGVRRIIYLGGLGGGAGLSSHLDSRQEVGGILAESGVVTIELRAAIILGSGSVSFEMIRALVEALPIMITPRWVATRTQPIGIEDVITYLTEALDLPSQASAIFEIGGPDQVSYGELMREYARQRRLRRWLIPVPVLTPRLSSLWLG